MSGNRILIDTNIILYILNGDETLASFLEDKELYVSYITEMELLSYHGFDESSRKSTTALLRTCTIIEMNHSIKQKAIQLRQVYRLKLPDSIVAATSLYLDCLLMSADKGFSKIKEVNQVLYFPS
jgi:predicted nucleic acid-binding protein